MVFIYLKYVVPSFVVFPIAFFLSRYKLFSFALRIVFHYLLISSLVNLIGILLVSHNLSNLWLLHVYTIIETEFFLLFFLCINKNSVVVKFIKSLLILFPILCIVNMIPMNQLNKFNVFPRSLEALLLIILSVNYWFRNTDYSYSNWSSDPLNWIISGILLYFSSSFSLFFLSDILCSHISISNGGSLVSLAWVIHGTLVIVQYLLFATGFNKYRL